MLDLGKNEKGGEIIPIDCSCQEGRTDHVFLAHQSKHIQNARFLNIQTFEEKHANFKMTIPTQAEFI
mgnify:FL=1